MPDTHHLVHPREREQSARYRGYVFGKFRLLCEQQPVKETMWRRNKVKSLLKWFLLNPGKLCSADEFIDLFWPDVSLETAAGNLHVTMHCLRHVLEPSLEPRESSTFIHRQANNFYWFSMNEDWWTDIADVQHLFETAQTFDRLGEDVKASFYYRKVVAHCSPGLLPEDELEEWLLPHRQQYEYIYLEVLMHLIQFYQQRNELDDVLEYAYLALAQDPYCEPAKRAIIDVYFQQGNMRMAMRQLDDFRDLLHQELGVGPSREMSQLETKILEAR